MARRICNNDVRIEVQARINIQKQRAQAILQRFPILNNFRVIRCYERFPGTLFLSASM